MQLGTVYWGQVYILDLIPGRTPKGGPRIRAKARCLCACGRVFTAYRHNIVSGDTKSCNRGTCAMRNRKASSERMTARTGESNPMFGKAGESHPTWKGDSVSYHGAHARVRRARGSASDHACADCGSLADDWSYQGNCPNEKLGEKDGYVMAYCPSAHEACMVPRCVPCHKRYDSSPS